VELEAAVARAVPSASVGGTAFSRLGATSGRVAFTDRPRRGRRLPDALSNAVSATTRWYGPRHRRLQVPPDLHLTRKTPTYRLSASAYPCPIRQGGRRHGRWNSQDASRNLSPGCTRCWARRPREHDPHLEMVMPADAFAGATQLIHTAIGDDWAELSRRIPALAA